jgi:hypothetical protein
MERKKRERCVFTIMNNEYDFFPIWLNYYSKFFDPQDIYVLDHNSEGEFFEQVQQLSKEGKFNLQRVYNYALFDHAWLQSTVCDFQCFLINSYNSTLFIEIDEIVATHPNSQFKNIELILIQIENESDLNWKLNANYLNQFEKLKYLYISSSIALCEPSIGNTNCEKEKINSFLSGELNPSITLVYSSEVSE